MWMAKALAEKPNNMEWMKLRRHIRKILALLKEYTKTAREIKHTESANKESKLTKSRYQSNQRWGGETRWGGGKLLDPVQRQRTN